MSEKIKLSDFRATEENIKKMAVYTTVKSKRAIANAVCATAIKKDKNTGLYVEDAYMSDVATAALFADVYLGIDAEKETDSEYLDLFDDLNTNREIDKLRDMAHSRDTASEIKSILFKLRKEYREIQRYVRKETKNQLEIRNDPVKRFADLMQYSISPEYIKSAVEELTQLTEQTRGTQRAHGETEQSAEGRGQE